MNKLQNCVMNMDFRKAARRFIIAALLIVILGGIVVGATLKTQIQEAITYHQTYDNGIDREASQVQAQTESDERDRYAGENHGMVHENENDGFLHSAQITEPSTGAKIVLGVYGLLCLLIGVFYWLLIAAWLYQAAEKCAMNGLLWAVLGIFFNLAAVLAFVLLRSRKAICPDCGRRQDAAEYCRSCGAAMRRKCSACGALTDIRDAYCSQCGISLKQESQGKTK